MATSTGVRQSAKHNRQQEENLQLRVCTYIRRRYPDAIFLGDYAAGLNLTNNQRIKMSQMRSASGQPDIIIDYPSRGYNGLRIELKREGTVLYKKDGTLRKQPYRRRFVRQGRAYYTSGDHLAEQEAMLKRYNELGYLARFAVGYDAAIKLIDYYFDQPEQAQLF